MAGGQATAAGIRFQAQVGAWFAAGLVADEPVGREFGLGDARARSLRFEAREYLDDVVVHLDDGGAILVQCKTSAQLSTRDPGLSGTVGQLVRLYQAIRRGTAPYTLERTAAVLAVSKGRAGRLEDLESACRLFDHGGGWNRVSADAGSEARTRSLGVFADSVREAWAASGATDEVRAEDLAAMARLFHVRSFAVDEGGDGRAQAETLMASAVYGGSRPVAASAFDTLVEIASSLMQRGGEADRVGVMNTLRTRGLVDVDAPRHRADITLLERHTHEELDDLRRHTFLPGVEQIPITRTCLPDLAQASAEGGVIVVGEPGCGKTGVLVALAERERRAGRPVVVLSVDRFAQVASLPDLETALRLEHPLLESLEAWPGDQRGLLVIDALDAARGAPAESVFADLVRRAAERLSARWSVVASIRTFDLENGRRFRDLIDAGGIKRFPVGGLTDLEIESIATRSSALHALATVAPRAFRDLLRNVFNLSIAAHLIESGVAAASIAGIETQDQLITRYENERLDSGELEVAVAEAVETMVARARLVVTRTSLRHPQTDRLLARNVLARSGDRVQFAHHVLFDHAAGRFFLDPEDPTRLADQVGRTLEHAFLLGPALRFALERVWREDGAGRAASWALFEALVTSHETSPIVKSIVLRALAESVATREDVDGLLRLIRRRGEHEDGLAEGLTRLSRFVGSVLPPRTDAGFQVSSSRATAWIAVAREAIATDRRPFAETTRFLLYVLSERADLDDPAIAAPFGEVARALLAFGYRQTGASVLTTNAIRHVARTFGTDPTASRDLLRRILDDRFAEHAHEDGHWLAEGVPTIAAHDPEFAVEIYAALFGREAPTSGKRWLHDSQILPLTVDKQQDYEMARWNLGRVLPSFLRQAPHAATRAVAAAAEGIARTKWSQRLDERVTVGSVEILHDSLTLRGWRREDRADAPLPGEDVLSQFVSFLKTCEPADYRKAIAGALEITSISSVWARLLGVAATREAVADDLLWPIASSLDVLTMRGLTRDAVEFVAAAYPRMDAAKLGAFEEALVAVVNAGGERAEWNRRVAGRIMHVLPEAALVTEAARTLRAQFDRENEIRPNEPFVRFSGGWVESDGGDHLVESEGADLSREPDRSLRTMSKELDQALPPRDGDVDPSAVVRIWVQTMALVERIDAALDAHPAVVHAAWGAVSNSTERIAETDAYRPGHDAQPGLDALVALLGRLAASPFPEPRERESSLMAWGNWDVRVYAASATMALAQRFGQERPELVASARNFLDDPEPTVRLQIAQALNTLWDADRERMWEMVEEVARAEPDPGVLRFFLAGPLRRLSGADPDRCERLVEAILARRPADGDDNKHWNEVDGELGTLAARLAVAEGRARALAWVGAWSEDLVSHDDALWSIVSSLREALFFAYREDATRRDREIQYRARETLTTIVQAAADAVSRAKPTLLRPDADEAEREVAMARYRSGERLLDHACNQLYFGSGTYREQPGEPIGLATPEAIARFLDEYRPLLDLLAARGSPRTAHHLLSVYEHCLAAAPEAVFDRIAALLLGPAREDGYQFEHMGSDTLVRLVRRYLADHRPIFADADRRKSLVDVLELFSSAGWPAALQLLHDLPDALR